MAGTPTSTSWGDKMWGFIASLAGRQIVIPAVTLVDSAGNEAGSGTAVAPTITGGLTIRPSANFTRPADTTTYASGDLLANSVTAGSVVAMTFAVGRAAATGGMIRRAKIRTSSTSVTNANFRLHLYATAPAVTNGDNGAWLSSNVANYLGAIDITADKAFSDGASGNGIPNEGSEINFTTATIYGLIEARGAYTPTSAGTFTIELEDLQN